MMDDDAPAIPGEGDGADEPYLTPVQANKIVSMMLNPQRRFNFDAKVVRFAIRQTIRNMKSSDPRVSNVAVANLIKMEAINQRDDLAALDTAMDVLNPAKPAQVQVGVAVHLGMAVQNALGSEPEYLDWLRERALAEGGNPDVVGANGHGGNGHALPDAGPHSGNGSSGNGHTEGNGRH